MDRNDMMYDGRRLPPRNSRGEFRRRRRGDRGMHYPEMHGDGRVIRSYPTIHRQGDYGHGVPYRENEMPMDYRGDMNMGDGHYGHGGRQGGYEPVEFMGYCTGYYGSPEDYGRGRDYGYDMRGGYGRGGRRDYGYDYGYDYGDYGETLSEEELKKWEHKLMSELDEREKQMFHKEQIMQKVRSMGKDMQGFGEKEMYVATLMVYTDYKHSIGQNPDLAIKLAYDWLSDKDVAVKGAEKLATYYDCIVEGE